MNDFTILHLSDLHINGTGNSLSRIMINLLEDIENEMEPVNNVILVVTGDLVHQAKYKEYKDNILSFFSQLSNVLMGKIRDAYFVPGNHDREHKPLDTQIIDEYNYKNSDQFYSSYWQYMKIGYIEYITLINEIYKILGIEREEKNTYSVRVSEIRDKRICFISFDTAWSSMGGVNDERKLKLGKFQSDEIYRQYQKELENGPFDLTIALGHHPLEWLEGTEETAIQAELLSKNRLGANVYMSGHIHNRDVINWQNNRHSMTTLVSGIGWPDGSENHTYTHVYSSYTFNLDLNSIDVYVRSSNEDNHFRPDFRIYTTNMEEKNRKIVMPINIVKTQAYFELGNIVGRSPKACYITDETIDSLGDLMHLIWRYRKHMYLNLSHMKYDYVMLEMDNIGDGIEQQESLQKLMDFFFNGTIEVEERPNYISSGGNTSLLELFESYLQAMCSVLAKLLANKSVVNHVRVHFRSWNMREEEIYHQLVMAESDFSTAGQKMKEQKWGELLKEAFEAKHPLIASVNESYCEESFELNKNKEKLEKQWVDFLTAIPFFEGNVYIDQDKMTGKVKKSRPYLTFGVTIYDERDRKLLYELDYMRIDEIIKDVIEDFRFYFPFEMKEFVEYKERGIK